MKLNDKDLLDTIEMIRSQINTITKSKVDQRSVHLAKLNQWMNVAEAQLEALEAIKELQAI